MASMSVWKKFFGVEKKILASMSVWKKFSGLKQKNPLREASEALKIDLEDVLSFENRFEVPKSFWKTF